MTATPNGWPVFLDPLPAYRGDSSSFTVRFWTDPDKTAPADLTPFGTVFALTIRPTPDSAAASTLAVDSSSAAAGVLRFAVAPADWQTFPDVPELGWDLQVSTSDGTQVTTLLRGSFTVTEDYTHG